MIRLFQRHPYMAAIGITGLVLAGIAFCNAYTTCRYGGCPDVSRLDGYRHGGSILIIANDGTSLADIAPVKHESVPLHTLPAHVTDAFLAVEDKRFRQHGGVDWIRVLGALRNNALAGSIEQGFSTITMQLARTVFDEEIPRSERTLERKLRELRVAREIERRYRKGRILELYLNHVYFGNRARGIAAAAREYFDKDPAALSLPEAALLAGLLRAPSHYDPRDHPRAALQRRNLVLSLMASQGRVPASQAERARAAPLGAAPRRAPVRETSPAPYFVAEVRRQLDRMYGEALDRQHLRVFTTLDRGVQLAAEEELARQLERIEKGRYGKWKAPRYAPDAAGAGGGTDYLQGALVMLSARTGEVLAWVGGRDYTHSQFDRVSQARRQAGSAFKPFVLAAALAHGIGLSRPLEDEPLRVQLDDRTMWEPKNYGGDYGGSVSLRDALVYSRNIPTVRLAMEVGYASIAELARAAGIGGPIPLHPSMPLGTVGVSPLEMAAAYTGFAGLGTGTAPRVIQRIERDDGRLVWESAPVPRQLLDPAVAFMVNDVLSDVVRRGTGSPLRRTGYKRLAAGKTGTTNEATDVWFVGYDPEITAAVWIGFDQPRSILSAATGGELAAPVWGRLMARYYADRPAPKAWTRPPEVVRLPVDPGTGQALARGCVPPDAGLGEEYFLRTTQVGCAFTPTPMMIASREDDLATVARAQMAARIDAAPPALPEATPGLEIYRSDPAPRSGERGDALDRVRGLLR